MRVDTISNPSSSDWFLVQYGTFTKNKNGLTPGETYRGHGVIQTVELIIHCHGHHLLRTQPTNRLEGGTPTNLDVYPNP